MKGGIMKSSKKTVLIYGGALIIGLLTAALGVSFGVVTASSGAIPQQGSVNVISVKDLEPQEKAYTESVLAEENQKGYVTIDDKSVLTSDDIRAKGGLIGFDQLQANTKFEIRQPDWLPEGTTIVGGVGEGPTEKGPWNSVRVFYSSKAGNFSIEEWDMSDGGVTMIAETMNVDVNGKKAASQKSKLRQSGKDWFSLNFESKGHFFTISGEVTPAIAKRIAESI